MAFALNVIAQETVSVPIVSEESIQKDVEKVDCDNDKRLDSVKKLFIEKGAIEKDIEIIDHENVKNLIVTKKGKTDEIVVLGAHYDKTDVGCGAIDNWTGIVIIANVFQTMKFFETNKTYKFVAFGREEDGLVGSRAMVKDIPKDDRINYCAMVNLDSFGFTYPQAMKNISTNSLIDLAEETAKDFKIPFGRAGIEFASSDSASFRSKGIPSISLHGLSGKWDNFLHTTNDSLKNIKYTSVYIGYNVTLRMLAKIDVKGCQDFR